MAKATLGPTFATPPVLPKTGNEAFFKVAFDETSLPSTPTYMGAEAQDWSLNVNFDTIDITPIGMGEQKLKISAGRTVTGSAKMVMRTDSEAIYQFIHLFAKISYDADGVGVGSAVDVAANAKAKVGVMLAIDAKNYYEAQVVVTSVSQASGGPNAAQTFDVNFEIIGELVLKVMGA